MYKIKLRDLIIMVGFLLQVGGFAILPNTIIIDSSRTIPIDPVDQNQFTISPTKAKAGENFALSALSYQYNCATTYTNLNSSIQNGQIYLSFLPVKDTSGAAICPAVYKPYGPSFQMEALKAGDYKVFVTPLIPCMIPKNPNDPVCAIATLPISAGTLTVEDSDTTLPPKTNFVLSPSTVRENVPSEISLLNYSFNCNSTYTNKAVTVVDDKINLSYLAKSPDTTLPYQKVCINLNAPLYGPNFQLPALKAGKYEVYSDQLPSCYPCKMANIRELAGILEVYATGETQWSLSPRKVEAKKDFNLQILNSNYNSCNNYFSYIKSEVSGNEITVSYVSNNIYSPYLFCGQKISPWGPITRLKGLSSGEYTVYVVEEPACVYDSVPCAVKLARQKAGVLSVTDSSQSSWYIQSKEQASGVNFDLELLNSSYGSCNTEFSETNVSIENGIINLSFTRNTYTDRICFHSVSPYGPTFSISAQKPGAYPIYAREIKNCVSSNSLKEICALGRGTELIDTLWIVDSNKIKGGGETSNIFETKMSNTLNVQLRADKLILNLPQNVVGAASFKIYSLEGKLLVQNTSANSIQQKQLEFPLTTKLKPGQYIVQVFTSNKVYHFKKLILKE